MNDRDHQNCTVRISSAVLEGPGADDLVLDGGPCLLGCVVEKIFVLRSLAHLLSRSIYFRF